MLIARPGLNEASEAVWTRLPVSSPTGIEPIAGRTEPIIRAAPDGGLEHDIRFARWLVDDPSKRIELHVREGAGLIDAYVPVFVHPVRMSYGLGELTLFSIPVQRFVIMSAPLILPGAGEEPGALMEDFVVRLGSSLGRNGVVFLEALRESCPLHGALEDPRSRLRRAYHVIRNGPMYLHRSIEFEGSYDRYLASLSAKTRADLKRTRRRLVDAVKGDCAVRCFTRPDEVAAFISDAMQVSRRTWQFNWLGAGLRDRAALTAQYEATAQLGWFRSYVLYAAGRPVAFQVGQLYDRTYYAREIGHDPDWRKLQPGIFLHTEIVPHLLSVRGQVTRWDFGNGDSLHKQRLANRAEPAGFFYLVPRTARGSALAWSMHTMNALSAGLGRGLDRLAIRRQMQTLLRRLGAAR